MSVKIRLARGGAKKRPYYRIVVADARKARDGKFIEAVGTYSPMLAKDNPQRLVINAERVKHWLAQGAQPSERVALFLESAKVGNATTQVKSVLARREVSKEAVQARLAAEAKAKADAEAKAKAEEEAAAAAAAAPAEEAPAA